MRIEMLVKGTRERIPDVRNPSKKSPGFTSTFSLRREGREADGVSFCYPAG